MFIKAVLTHLAPFFRFLKRKPRRQQEKLLLLKVLFCTVTHLDSPAFFLFVLRQLDDLVKVVSAKYVPIVSLLLPCTRAYRFWKEYVEEGRGMLKIANTDCDSSSWTGL